MYGWGSGVYGENGDENFNDQSTPIIVYPEVESPGRSPSSRMRLMQQSKREEEKEIERVFMS